MLDDTAVFGHVGFAGTYSVNSMFINAVALSDIDNSGNPSIANILRSSSMVADNDNLFVTWTSIHFECALIMMRNIFPLHRASIINVYLSPQFLWPCPSIHWHNWWNSSEMTGTQYICSQYICSHTQSLDPYSATKCHLSEVIQVLQLCCPHYQDVVNVDAHL